MDRINLDTWIEALPLSDNHKKQIRQVVSQKLPDIEFEIDKNYANRLIRKQRFHGDNGLKVEIEVSEDTPKKVIRSVKYVDEPGKPPYYCITIHTEKWEEVS